MTAPNVSFPAKTHISLRLPTFLLESVDAHAEKENISRTDALVYYLQAGLEFKDAIAHEPSREEQMFMAIQNELADIKALLQAEQLAVPVPVLEPSSLAALVNKQNKENAAVESDAKTEEKDKEDSVEETDSCEHVTTGEVPCEEEPLEQADAPEQTDTPEQTEDFDASCKKLEKAVAKAAKEISAIEKVWLYGAAAEREELADDSIDLCIKTENDEKLKSKHLEAFVAAIEEKMSRTVKVVLRHEGNKELKQALKNKVELYKK